MRLSPRPLALGAVLLAALVSSCDSPTRPPTHGALRPRIELVRDTLGLMRANLPFTSVTATVTGDSYLESLPLELQGGSWRGEFTNVPAGTYSVTVVGRVTGDSVQHYGVNSNVSVSRGQSSQPPIPFAALAPDVPTPTATTLQFSANISIPPITNATQYQLHASQSPTFATLPVNVTQASPAFTVNFGSTGKWYYRIRPVIGAYNIRFSEPESLTINDAVGGLTPGNANTTTLVIGTPDTLESRNITGTKTEDWFQLLDLRVGDSLFVETRAARLTPPSPLDTRLELFRSDNVTAAAPLNDDFAGLGTDSRIVTVIGTDETHYARVTGANATPGHFDFIYLVRRLPAAPTGLTATAAGTSSITLAWVDNATPANAQDNGYDVLRCTGVGCDPTAAGATLVATTAQNATGYTDNGLTADLTYRYAVRARQDATHFSGFSNTATVLLSLPTVPTGLTTTLVSATQIDLDWVDSGLETGYEVERCDGVGCAGFALLATLPAGTIAYSDNTVTYGNDYSYRVRAVNDVGPSAYSATAAATTQPPATPGTLTAVTVDSLRITLGWLDQSDNEDGFRVERCAGAGCLDFAEIGTVNADVQVYIDSTVSSGTDYRYRVRSYHLITSQAYSNVADADTRPAVAPSSLAATVVVGQIQLTWLDNADDEVLVEVERCDFGGCVFATIATLPGAGNVAYADLTVSANQAYTYRVRALNVAGYSTYSNEVTAYTTIGAVATGLTATTMSGSRIDLGWTDNANGETGYVIERCAGDGCSSFASIGTAAADATAYSDETVAVGEAYTYRVRTSSEFGVSGPSNEATSTTRVPDAPTTLVATTLSNTSIGLTWVDVATTESGYAIDRCAGPGCSNFTEVTTLGAGATGYTDTGLSPSSEYSYRVRATNAVGSSPPSNVATATTNLPAIPTALAGEVTTVDEIRLTWTDNATDETDQRLERCSSSPSCTDFTEIATIAADVVEYFDAGLVPGTAYRYRLRARNGAGYSDYSNEVTISAGVPASANSLSATTVSAVRIDLAWVDASDNEARFIIERCTGAACIDFAALDTVSADVSAYVDGSVTAGNEYRYRIITENGAGPAAAPSNAAGAHTISPAAPTGLAAATFSSSRIDLSWADGGDYETGYQIERCTGAGCTDFALIVTTGANVVAYSDAGLTQGLNFRYRIRAVNAVGVSAYDGPVDGTTDIPSDPTDFTAVASSPTSVQLDWTDNADNETAYTVERCTGVGCGNFSVIALLASDVETYSDGSPAFGETYRYRVQAVGLAGPSQYTPAVTVVMLAPAAPTDFSVTTTGGSAITLAWTDVADNELGYEINRCAGVGCSVFAEIANVPANSTGYVDNAVAVGESYTYRIRATNLVGDSPYAGELTANTFLPATPSDLAATTIANDRIDLTWTDLADNEGGYRIERCAGAGCSTFALLTEVAPNSISYQDLGLATGESFTYRILAFNVAGTSSLVGPVTATTILPAAPTALTALVTSASTIELSWTDNADNESGYRIERCAGVGCSSFIEIATVGADQTTYTSTGLAGNSFYSHRVRAFNAAGTSAYSGTVASNTFAPGPPSTLVATTQTATSVGLTWTDNSGNEAGFRIERCTGVGCASWAEIATVGIDVEAFVDNAAPAAASNSYRVRAYNGVGPSSFTNTATVSTVVPAAPTGLTATAQGQAAIQVLWTDNATTETGYVVERCAGVGCTDFTVLIALPANANDHVDATVVAGTAYRYRVAAVGNGSSDYSNIGEATTILPAAPTALTAIAISDDRVDLSWTDNADNETGYRIERCLGAACTPLSEIVLLGANVTSHTDLTVASGNVYRYVVKAVNDAGSSAPSDTAQAATDIPGLPTSLGATVVSGTQVDLTWTDNATTETGFSIERCSGAACTDFAEIFVAAADAEAYSDLDVVVSTSYRYRVRAVNANGTSGYTNIATAATNPPAAPTDLAAVTVSATRIDLSWTDNSNNETFFFVWRCDGAPCGGSFTQIASVPPNTTGYQDLTVTGGNSYTYRVQSMNAVDVSAFTADVPANTLVPADPTGLAATTISATRIDLSWTDNADNETGVRVERCEGGGCTSFAEVVTLAANATAYSDEGLTAGLLYRYRVVMVNAAGESGPSNVDEASTDFPIPPSALTATTVSATQIDLAWTDNAGNEDGFEIERCEGDGCDTFAPLASVLSDVTTYQDLTVTLGNFYTYRVRAVNFAGASDFAPAATANTNVPAAPTIVSTVALSPTEVRVTWAAQAATTGYLVERCEAAACTYATVSDKPHPTTEADDPVTTGITYRYRVVAYNAAGSSAPSAELEIAMAVPNPASGLVGIALSNTQASLTWTDNAVDETTVQVQRCVGAGCVNFSTIATLPANAVSHQDDGLAAGGVYTYRIVVENAVGAAGPSNAAAVSLNAPQAPTGLSATTTGPGVITLNWIDNSDRELQYAIERCTGGACLDFVQVALVGANVTNYPNSGLDLNATFRYRVRALNNVGPSPYTLIATANTILPAPASGLVATTIHGERVDLTWVDNSLNESGFRIQRCTGASCTDFVQIAQVGANVVAASDLSATFGNVYNYRIVAANISGDAAPSNVAQASTNLNAPTGLFATTLNRTDIRLTWNDVGSFEAGYQIFRCEGAGCSSFVDIATVGGAVTQYTDVGLNPASDYTYRVRALTVGGTSALTGSAGARTPIPVLNGELLSIPADTFQSRRLWVVSLPPGLSEFRVQFTPVGFEDPDLYVRRGLAPTQIGFFAADTLCGPYSSGVETCVFPNPPAGDYFIMMHGFSAYTGGTVAVNVQFEFTTCAQSGNLGPSQAQCDAAYSAGNLAGDVSVSGGVQTFTLPYAGTYEITAIGAQGASGDALYLGGRGAEITGTFVLTGGSTVKVAVGQMGTGQASGSNGGGGGGSFVTDGTDNPLLIAGGGGGTRTAVLQNGCNASLTNYGTIASGGLQNTPCTVKVDALGAGGIVSASSWGSAGAGFFGNGASDAPYGLGGSSWGNGLIGGTIGTSAFGVNAMGGFGGGGAGNGGYGGGGGGGYSGGDGGRVAGGGGSYNTGSSPSAFVTANSGHGRVRIRWIGP